MLKSLKNHLSSRFGIFSSVALIGALAVVMFAIPQITNIHTSAENCANPPITPTFNHWPVTYDDANTPLCHDFPAIDAGKYVQGQDTVFSQSQSDWQDGLTLNTGEQGVALLYLHNGAANNLDPSMTTARNVKVTTQTDTSVGGTHTLRVTYSADNAASYTKTFTVNTPSNAKLEVLSNSGQMYDYEGRVITGESNLNLGNSTYTVGDLDACFEYSVFLSFKFRVVADSTPQDTTLSIDKSVKNITDNTGYSSSVNADQNDRVGYKVVVTNTGSTTATAVTMSDAGVSGVSIDRNSVKVGSTDSNSIASNLWSGTLPGTLNLGDLAPGEKRYISYEASVTASNGTKTNTAYADASNTDRVSDTARVVINDIVTPGHGDLRITKSVDDSEVRSGDTVRFTVTVTNTGDETVNNVRMEDNLPSGFDLDDIVSSTSSNYDKSGNRLTVRMGDLDPNESSTIKFDAKVTASGDRTICNTAYANGDDVNEVSDDACVRITQTPTTGGGNPNIVISKKAYNDTKKVDAVSTYADRGNYITFTLTTTNTGNATARNYVIKDDLSGVLPLADLISAPGAKLSGNVLSYDAMDIRAGETVTKTFQVKVKESLASTISYRITNTYGNTVVITVPGQVTYQAPKTGSAATSAGVFAGLVTAGFVIFRKRESILKFILA
ncbi:MAG: DUF11 domain-containing protein [Candidatus Doudnabacteria bacterium]